MSKATDSQGCVQSFFPSASLISTTPDPFLDEFLLLEDALQDVPEEVFHKVIGAFSSARDRSLEEYNELMAIAETLQQELKQGRQGGA
jgi:hypothetical protein